MNQGSGSGSGNSEPEWRFRLSWNNALAELLQGFNFLTSFRKKETKPSDLMDGEVERKQAVNMEEIELVDLNNVQVESDCCGSGHTFRSQDLGNPTFCDQCKDATWGHSLRCTNCSYTCHQTCRERVNLDCPRAATLPRLREPADPVPPQEPTVPVEIEEISGPSDDPQLEEVHQILGPDLYSDKMSNNEELQKKIEEYNRSALGFKISVETDGTYRGFVRVHMNLSRPISIVAGTRPPSIYDILKDDESIKRTLTTFYLPRDTMKTIHITSETTTMEMIRALLKKFKVVDSPRKFALYERFQEQEGTFRVHMRRLGDNEKPLRLALQWGSNAGTRRLVLQENETGDILWEAFSVPELTNFLRILDREEDEYCKQVRCKYRLMNVKIQEAMERLRPSGPEPRMNPEVNMNNSPLYDNLNESSVDSDEESDSGSIRIHDGTLHNMAEVGQ